MFSAACAEIGAPIVSKKLKKAWSDIDKIDEGDDISHILGPARASVLSTAVRFGKARFAQVCARHVDQADELPKYIIEAVNLLVEDAD